MDVNEILYALADDPEIMPPAPYDWTVSQVEHRRRFGGHDCLMCALLDVTGSPADSCIVATSPQHPEHGPRWLDLCWECYGKIKTVVIEADDTTPIPYGSAAFWN